MRVRAAQHREVQGPGGQRVEGERFGAADDPAGRGSRDRAPHGPRRHGRVHRRARDGLADRAVPRAPAEVALEVLAEVLVLLGVRAEAVTTIPAVQKPHWNPAASTNRCWTSPSRSGVPSPATVVTSRPAARSGVQAGVDGGRVDEHRAGAAVAGVAALLDLDVAGLAQQRAQALAGSGLDLAGVPVDGDLHDGPPLSSSTTSAANRRVVARRQSGAPWTSSNQRPATTSSTSATTRPGVRHLAVAQHVRPRGRRGDGEHETPVGVAAPDDERRGPPEPRERSRRNAVVPRNAVAGRWIDRSTSPGARRGRPVPRDELLDRQRRTPPSAAHSSADPVEGDSERGHGPRGSAAHTFPPTVAPTAP